jgi:hypothetical protein
MMTTVMLTVFIGGAIVRAYVISKLWEWFVARHRPRAR